MPTARTSQLAKVSGALASAALLASCGNSSHRVADEPVSTGTVAQALVDLSTCGPKNLARNTTGSGTPSPLGSDSGVLGDVWDLVDGQTEYAGEQNGLQFNSGGTHQVTVDLGGHATLDKLTVWHHSDTGEPGHNIPASVALEYFDGSIWQELGYSRSFDLGYPQPAVGFGSYPDSYAFSSAVVASKVRWSFDGDGLSLLEAVVAISAGSSHVCAVRRSGSVACWGRNQYGQLGDGGNADAALPVPVVGLPDAVSVAGGGGHSCALRKTGEVACWGLGSEGQLGTGSTASSTTPVPAAMPDAATAVVAGQAHACALLVTGQVVCWGENAEGQLGDGTSTSSGLPVFVSGLSDVVGLSAGRFGQHTCARRATGQVACWGGGDWGQLGNGGLTGSNTPVGVTGLGDVTAIGAGGAHTCAVRSSGEVMCWGFGGFGQLGNGATVDSPIPVTVLGLSGAVAVALADWHTCALTTSGSVACWGSGELGRLGSGNTIDSAVPVAVTTIDDAQALSAGGLHTCALLDAGEVACWGSNVFGELGTGSTGSANTPVAAAISDVAAVATGSDHTCSIDQTGSAACWGNGRYGQLGTGDNAHSSIPQPVSGLANAVQIAAGLDHTCAVRATGTIDCWGLGQSGQLGNGTNNDSNVPLQVAGVADAAGVAAGFNHTCVIGTTGNVSCWGLGSSGQLGNSGTASSSTPVVVSNLDDAIDIAAGIEHTCAVRETGSVACWGRGAEGQLGNGANAQANSPVAVSGIVDAQAISASAYHTCALLSSGQATCWGYGADGQLGNGATAGSNTPVPVSGLTGALALSGGLFHTCALTQTGAVACWGFGVRGELGNGDNTNSSLPVLVSGLNDAVSLSKGTGSHTCAARLNGTLACWGFNPYGQLGNGTQGHSTTPKSVSGLGVELWQAWPYQVSVNGCPEPASPESVLETNVPAGGTLTTDTEGDGATLADPVETTVTTPTGGDVSIVEVPFDGENDEDFTFLGQQVLIESPAAPVTSPLRLVFVIDSSLLLEGADVNDVLVFRNGVPITGIEPCVAPPAAIPATCVASRTMSGDDAVITILTTLASTWTFGVAVESDDDSDGTLDFYDQCSDTPAGEIVDAEGCSVAQLCPCQGPRETTDNWKNQGRYVACVSHAATEFRQAGLIEKSEVGSLVREAARSGCGQK